MSGGLVGWQKNGSIRNAYALGRVEGREAIGGLIGEMHGQAADSYWNIQTSGLADSADGKGLSSAQMFTGQYWAGFDF